MIIRVFAAIALLATNAFALGTDAQEARAQNLFHDIRCVVCEAQSIADSPAAVASDMRREIRKRINAGESDEAIKAYLVSRYGNIVLMRPPLEFATLLLWFGPLLILAAGGWVTRSFFTSPLRGEVDERSEEGGGDALTNPLPNPPPCRGRE